MVAALVSRLQLLLDEAWNRLVAGGARAAFVGLPHEGAERDHSADVEELRRGEGRMVRW